MLAVGCPEGRPPEVPKQGVVKAPPKTKPLGFRLSNDDSPAIAKARPTPPAATPLSDADAKTLAARLPAADVAKDDEKAFSFPAKSLPAPRAGKTTEEAFPPKAVAGKPPGTARSPLTVERHAPDGAVAIAPQVSVTFSQPMIALGTVEQSAAAPPPVKITPLPRGKWQWLGTQTVTFQPEIRFAMATDYVVEIPAGATAASGARLPAAVRWTFTTPAPKVIRSHPSGASISREPLLFIELDQDIDPAALLASITLTPAAPLRLATAAEIEADESVKSLVATAATPKRWIAFRPTKALPAETSITATLHAGARSAEGPRRTDRDQTFDFKTYGALRIAKTACGWSDECRPFEGFRIELTNAIDPKRFDRKSIRISPELVPAKIEVQGTTIWIGGPTKGRTRYDVTVSGGITDVYGQTLGRDSRLAFKVNSADPLLYQPEDNMIVLDPSAPRTYSIYSVNQPSLRTRVYRVGLEDWPGYVAYRADPKKHPPPGKLVVDQTLTPPPVIDELARSVIDLTPVLVADLGQALVIVDDLHPPPPDQLPRGISVWIQSTQLGLGAFVDPDRVTGWVTRLTDGAAVDGATVGLLGAASSAPTDASGLGSITLDARAGSLLYAKKGGDLVIAPGSSGFARSRRTDTLKWLVFDDRGTYRPGETVHLKGWLRRATAGRNGDLDRVPDARTISFHANEPRGTEIGKGTAVVDAQGGFDIALSLPANANTGMAALSLHLDGSRIESADFTQRIEIAEYRKPEFQVTAKPSEGPLFVGDHGVATVNASYYTGGGLSDSKADWTVTRARASFSPPNRSDYRFGPSDERDDAPTNATWTGHTDATGAHRLRVDFDPSDPPYPMRLSLSATVEDKNHQSWSADTTMLVHPADTYVGLRLERAFGRVGEPLRLDLVATDLDGKPRAARPITVNAARIDWDDDLADGEEKLADQQSIELESAADGAAHVGFKTPHGGLWRVWAIVTDAAGRRNRSALTGWVTGDDVTRDRRIDPSKLTLVTDKPAYQPGEEAEVLVVAPFVPAEGVLTVRRQGVVKLERFTMTHATQTMKVKLDETHVPNVEIGVSLVGAAPREDDSKGAKRPAYADGTIALKVLPTSRRLAVTVTPRVTKIEPGGKTQIEVDVKDAAGKPAANAKVAVIVADEAVLALSGYALPDPIGFFYAARTTDVHAIGMREHVILRPPNPDSLSASQDRDADGIPDDRDRCPNQPETYNGYQDQDGCPDLGRVVVESNNLVILQPKIITRKNFSPLALFAPHVAVDAAGHASVPLTLPDNLTRYRIMAVVAAGDRQFGASESTITARLPLMVRPSAPRFLSFGDRFELPVLVQNQTDAPVEASVIVRATNATITGAAAKKVAVPPNDRVEVRFDLMTAKAGTARFQVAARAGAASDASEIAVPVHTPATSEAFATYGEIDDGAVVQLVTAPTGVIPGFGALEVTTSSTALQSLTDAVLYLVKYPYECAEQVSSRILAIASLRDVLASFHAEGLPSPEALNVTMKSDLEKLSREQLTGGGWSFWGDGEAWPYLSVHVAHALVRAKEKGYAPEPTTLEHAREYLRGIETHMPAWYPQEERRAIAAYALHVRKRMGDPDPARAKELLRAGLSVEGLGWIWPTLVAEPENEQIRLAVANRVTETADAAHFASSYDDGARLLLASDRRADAILLEALIAQQPTASVIPKIVKGLLAHRTSGRWQSTQENAFVLLALSRYFEVYEKTTPDFVARVWLGEQFAGEHPFHGRTTERSRIGIPLDRVTTGHLTLAKDGPGRLYFRVGMQYAPQGLALPASDRGFVVTRAYEPIDRPDDVARVADGWRVRAGSRVRVRLTMMANARRYHVALVDPLPAGFEPMNPTLAGTGPIPHDGKEPPSYDWSLRHWYEHENLRDDRVEAFAPLVWEGVHEYSYVARATTAGVFIAAPTKAEEMYSPETFGRGASERVTIFE